MVHIQVSQAIAKNADADFIWSKLADYYDMNWHPGVKDTKKVAESTTNDKDSMVGAVRIIVNSSGKELTETVTEWDETARHFTMSIDKGAPPFAKKMMIKFQVREEEASAAEQREYYVDMIVDVDLKLPFMILAPLIKVVLPKKLKPFVSAIATLRQDA